jgi:hypothetical protein
MANGKKLCFIVNVYMGTKNTVSLGKFYSPRNVATVVYRVTTGVYTIKSYFYINKPTWCNFV